MKNITGRGLTRLVAGLATALMLAFTHPLWSAEEHEEHAHEEEEHGVVALTPAQVEENDIGLQQAGPGELIQSVLLYGTILPDPQQVSHVSARYPGLIRSVRPALGERVEAGDTIATVEASSSLQSYEITAPISGVVVDRHANPGEIAGDNILLTIADYTQVWADLSIFPNQASQIRAGQRTRISAGQLEADGEIRYLNPGEGSSVTMSARLPVANPDLQWTPGMLVEGRVVVGETAVDLVVDNGALQSFEGNQGVFVKEGTEFHFRPLVLGQSDGRSTEVLQGIAVGEEYVTRNSYLLKADLEKSGASHSH